DVQVSVDAAALPAQLLLHLGTAELPVRVRALGGRIARLSLPRPVPLQVADRAILRDPGAQVLAASVRVVDPDPPALTRRGAAPLDPGLRVETAVQQLDLPDRALLESLVAHADLQLATGRVRRPGTTASLGDAEAAVRALERRLAAAPFAAPDRADLGELGLR